MKKKKVILILGTTASGKSTKALHLAKKMKAEIISADSRQIFKKMEIFSGLKKEEKKNHLVNFLNPEENFSAGDFKKKAEEKITEINNKNKAIIITAGTVFYLEALLFENFLPPVKINLKLRKELEKKSIMELLAILKEKDFQRFQNIDQNNKIRIIRALEIIEELGKVPLTKKQLRADFDLEIIYLENDWIKQKEKIAENFKERLENGFLTEAENLKKYFENLNWTEEKIKNKFYKFGLAYKFIFDYWEKKIDLKEFVRLGILEEQKYAKRQKTYLKKFLKNF